MNNINEYLNDNYESLCESFCYSYEVEYEQFCRETEQEENNHIVRSTFCDEHTDFIDFVMNQYRKQGEL